MNLISYMTLRLIRHFRSFLGYQSLREFLGPSKLYHNCLHLRLFLDQSRNYLLRSYLILLDLLQIRHYFQIDTGFNQYLLEFVLLKKPCFIHHPILFKPFLFLIELILQYLNLFIIILMIGIPIHL